MKHALTFILFFLFFNLFAQTKTYEGKILNSENNTALSGVKITIRGKDNIEFSNTQGFFKLKADSNDVLMFSKVGYEVKYVFLNEIDSTNFNVFMETKIQRINEINISANRIDTLLSNPKINIIDYEVENGFTLLLTYKRKQKDCKLSLLNPSQDTLMSIDSPKNCRYFFRDCFGEINLVCSDSVYRIQIKNERFVYDYGIETKTFEESVFPCVTSTNEKLFFEEKLGAENIETGNFKFTSNNDLVIYYSIDKKTKESEKLAIIYDKVVMKMKRDEMDYLLAKKTARMYCQSPMGMEFDLIFSQMQIFKEIYAPIFNHKDSIVLFDCINDKLEVYDTNNAVVLSSPIDFHKTLRFKHLIKKDSKTNSYYAFFSDGISVILTQINVYTGKIIKEHTLPYSYPEKIKIENGFAYFLIQEDTTIPYKSFIKYRL